MKKNAVKDWLLNNILAILSMIPGLVGFLATIIGHALGMLTWLDFLLMLALLIIITLIVIRAVWNMVSYKSYHYPWSKIRTIYNYTVLEKKITYRRDSDDVLHYSRMMKIRCCSNRVDHAYDKYIWTGIQPAGIKIVPVRGIANIEDKSRIGIWHYFVIELSNHMGRGDEQEISYKWPDIPQCKKSLPFFSTSTDEPTQKLILSLELGDEYANQEIICEEFRAIEADYPINSMSAQLDDRGTYAWEIPRHKVKRFRYYRIRWSWNKGQPAAEIE